MPELTVVDAAHAIERSTTHNGLLVDLRPTTTARWTAMADALHASCEDYFCGLDDNGRPVTYFWATAWYVRLYDPHAKETAS